MPPAAHPYGLGLDLAAEARAKAELASSGRYCTVAAPAAPRSPSRSLAGLRLAHLEQGQFGTCHEHAVKQCAETTGAALGYQVFPISRRMIGWVGMQLAGGGNQADGGSPTYDLIGMTTKGAGICHESVCPYVLDYNVLGQRPSAAAFADAKQCHLNVPVVIRSVDQMKTMIDAGHSCANGVLWPAHWDDSRTFMDAIGPIAKNPDGSDGGHALCVMGYAEAGVFDAYAWLQLDNWHGLLYPPLPPQLAAKVPGYKPIRPDRTSDFWVRQDVYIQLCNMGMAEHIAATDMDGLVKGQTDPDGKPKPIVDPGPSFLDAIPI
jgi:hypothetical protein